MARDAGDSEKSSRFRRSGKWGVICFFLGALSLIGGDRLAIPFLSQLGVLMLGGAFIGLGLDSIVTRSHTTGSGGRYAADIYAGIHSVLWGGAFILIGIGVWVVGAIWSLGLGQATVDFLKRRPGLMITYMGLVFLLIGLAQTGRWRRFIWRGPHPVVMLPRRIGGALLAVVSVAIIAVGMFEVLFPSAFDAICLRLWEAIPKPPEFPRSL